MNSILGTREFDVFVDVARCLKTATNLAREPPRFRLVIA